jgi:glutamate N-acetyltransferase/amino-acid N-acetyltransferase
MELPAGFLYAATYAGIRKAEKNDLALIVSERPAAAAALFTTNLVQAAPVRLARAHLKKSRGVARAILVNAGNANCATRTGDAVALASCRAAAKELRVPVEQVLPASTGVIGVELDAARITGAVPVLARRLMRGGFDDVASAILTTDTRQKVASESVRFRQGIVRIAGMTKGAGMIHPRLATTLAFVMLDARLSAGQLRGMLVQAAERSFNRISVDGDTSTNDMVAVLANGAADVTPDPKERKVLAEVLCWVLEDLAEQIVLDGEGARKLVRLRVSGARDAADAEKIARAIANSPLVKTAIAGADPNWGRILSAAGTAGAKFDPRNVDITLQNVPVCRGGLAADFSEAEMKQKLAAREISLRFTIRGPGKGETVFHTCDLTEEYIRINASYRT